MSADFTELLNAMLEYSASDLHIKVGAPPKLRIKGDLHSYGEDFLKPDDTRTMIYSFLNESQIQTFEEKKELDCSLSISGIGRFRANVFYGRGSIGAVLRRINNDIPDFESLNLPKVLEELSNKKRGIILVTGTAGSGKSTTLAAMIDYMNNNRNIHILTIEDPIEFLHKDKNAIVNQREVGLDTDSYLTALKSSLRQNPDVILIGEMRDSETVEVALSAAETGHLVLSTLHTIDASQTISRLINFFPAYKHDQIRMQLSLTIQGIISQRLLVSKDQTGMVPSVEVLIGSALVKKLILENKINEVADEISKGKYYSMQTFNQSLVQLIKKDLITTEEAYKYTTKPQELKQMFMTEGI